MVPSYDRVSGLDVPSSSLFCLQWDGRHCLSVISRSTRQYELSLVRYNLEVGGNYHGRTQASSRLGYSCQRSHDAILDTGVFLGVAETVPIHFDWFVDSDVARVNKYWFCLHDRSPCGRCLHDTSPIPKASHSQREGCLPVYHAIRTVLLFKVRSVLQ